MPDSITLINHATVLFRLGQINILTDPIYSRTVSLLFPRLQRPGIALVDLPSIDFILISHSDYDHLNMKTLRRLRRKRASTIIFPKGLGFYGRKAGFGDIVEMSWWETIDRTGLRVTCVPARHRSKRRPDEAISSACCGYVVECGGRTLYFAGDTAYGDLFAEIGHRFNIDVGLLPIGAYKPEKWLRNLHLDPVRAIQAFLDLRAQRLVPIHWGTFWISDEPMAEPPRMLRAEAERMGITERVHLLANGESLAL